MKIKITYFLIILLLNSSCNVEKSEYISSISNYKIASFRIDDFGQDKLNNIVVINHIAKICKQFDVIGIQGINSENQNILPELVLLLEEDILDNWNYEVSNRIGEKGNYEQYAILYKSSTFVVSAIIQYEESDSDLIFRDPFYIQFTKNDYSIAFALINISKENINTEIPKLVSVFDFFKTKNSEFVLMGNFSASSDYIDDWFIEHEFAIPNNVFTKVNESVSHDNFIYKTNPKITESGVFNFKTEYGLTQTEAEAISSHYPIWFRLEFESGYYSGGGGLFPY